MAKKKKDIRYEIIRDVSKSCCAVVGWPYKAHMTAVQACIQFCEQGKKCYVVKVTREKVYPT